MQLDESHAELKSKMQEYLAGEASATDLKHASAPLGVYQQRNDQFMARLRITGGHLTLADLRTVAGVITSNGIGYAHLTTRQDIQLQDVPAEQVCDVVQTCNGKGLPFRGGGGNTFRNIAASPASGIGADSLFDVMPYAKSLNDLILGWDKAFQLPRKLKIGFYDSPSEELAAAVQDLGFAAKVVDGKPGFKVYGGGGMGRESAVGVTLFDFLPAYLVPKCALAMTELFYDHGNRENRNQARIRFIVKRLGEGRFVELFQEYFAEADPQVALFPGWELDLTQELAALQSSPGEAPDNADYRNWLARAVSPTRFDDDVVTVRVFVPGGDLLAAQLGSLAELAEKCGGSFLRLTPAQDVLVPLVRRDSLPSVYRFLKTAFPATDVLLDSLVGHVVTCVGSTVCKIGILDSPAAGEAVARSLDGMLAKRPELGPAAATRVVDCIRISGCPNSCAGHPIARVGLQGQKARIGQAMEPVYQVFARPGDALAISEPVGGLVKEPDIADTVRELILAQLK